MPKLNQYLHYRIIDVSSFKEIAIRFCPNVLDIVAKVKGESHRALEDIKQSIQELKIYL